MRGRHRRMAAQRSKRTVTPEKQPSRSRRPASGDVLRQRPLAPEPAAPIPAARVRSLPRHPLLYRKRIDRIEKARPGDLVAVYGPGEHVAGLRPVQSAQRDRRADALLRPGAARRGRWQERLDQAVALRRDLLRLDAATDAYRLVHAEADGLSGPGRRPLRRRALGRGLQPGDVPAGRGDPGAAGRRAAARGHTLVRPSPQFLSQEGHEPPEMASPDLPERGHDPRSSARGSASALPAGTRRASSATSGRTAAGWPSSAQAAACWTCAATRAGSPCRPSVSATPPR